jgi:hypothetical protein
MKLTGTNRSIGLINSSNPVARSDKTPPSKQIARSAKTRPKVHTSPPNDSFVSFDDLAAIARGNTPDPIPNSAVKTLSANGTTSQGVGE